MLHRSIRAAVVLVVVVTLFSLTASTQVPDPVLAASAPVPGVGHHYIGNGVETVNPVDGSLTFDLPLQPASDRGLTLPFGIHFGGSYQYLLSNQYPPGSAGGLGWYQIPAGSPLQSGAWSYNLPVVSAQSAVVAVWHTCGQYGCDPNANMCWAIDDYVFHGLDGQQTSLGLGSFYPSANSPNACAKTQRTPGNRHGIFASLLDQSGSPAMQVVDQSGTTYQFPGLGGSEPSPPNYYPLSGGVLASSITDRNGNQIVASGNGYTDSTGRTVVSWTGIGHDGDQITVAGLGGPVTLRWTTTNVSFRETGYNVDSSPNTCSIVGPISMTIGVVSEIDLPNGQKYTFTYDGTYGKISKITFPNGGFVRYLWGLNRSAQLSHANWSTFNGVTQNYYCDFIFDIPVITDRFVSFDGANEVVHQQFTYSTNWSGGNSWGSKQTVVTSTDAVTGQVSKTTYNYSSQQGDPPAYVPPPPYLNQIPVESSVIYQDGTGSTTYKTVNKSWQSPHVMLGEQTILDNNSNYGTTTLRCYDSNDQVTNLYEYGFSTEGSYPGDPSCVSSSGLNAAARGPLRRQTATPYAQFWNWNNGSPTGTHIVNAPNSVAVADGSGTAAKQTLYSYDENALQPSGAINLTNPGTTRANITTLQRWISGTTYAKGTYQYYDTGQLYKMTDACGNTTCSDMTGTDHTTTYSYADNYAAGTGTPPGQTNAYLTSVTFPNTGAAHTESFTWGYTDGQIRSRTDQNGRPTSFFYNDPGLLGRLTEIDGPDGGTTTVAYNDSTYSAINNTPNFTVTKKVTSSLNLVTTTAFDGLGHTVRTLTSDPEGSGTIYADTVYTGLAQAWKEYNPYRSVGDATYGFKRNSYDPLGRLTSTQMQDGSGSTASTSYSGSCTTVIDEAGKSRTSCNDGLGYMTKVLEDPGSGHLNYETDYQYDILGNMLCAVQKATDTGTFTNCASSPASWRPRSFAYDGLSRLAGSTNPESGTISYLYDVNGNVTTRTAPMPNKIPADSSAPQTLTTTYTYDSLNRLTRKQYSDTTPQVKYGYDGIALTGCGVTPPTLTDTNPIGRRTQMCDPSGATTWALNIVASTGWKTTEKRKLNGLAAKTTISQNNLGGMLAKLTYPSGRVINYAPNSSGSLTAARYLSATDSDGTAYVSSATYAGFGGITSFTNGGAVPINTSNSYNERLQPVVLSAGTTSASLISLSYDFHRTSGDNGLVYQVVNNVDNLRSQTYTYDPLNRVATAYSQAASGTKSWGETFTIDAWGNLTNRGPANGKTNYEPLNVAPASVKNQPNGFCYDKAGNLLGTASCPALPYNPTYTYDAENRVKSVSGVTYTYDGDGNRVIKSSGTLYWGSGPLAESDLLASSTSWKEYVFFNGERVARRDASNSTVHYFFSNHVGSTSIIVNGAGGVNNGMEEDLDYYPYGGIAYGTSSDHYMFSGKERDAENGNDNFGARYYGSGMGRFLTPDWAARPTAVPYALVGDPQSLNLYAMVRNDPVSLTDADGHVECANAGDTASGISCPSSEALDKGEGEYAKRAKNKSPQAAAASAAAGCLAGGCEAASSGTATTAASTVLTDVLSVVALPLIVLDYVISPGTTATEDKDMVHLPPSTSQQGTVNNSPMAAEHTSGARPSTEGQHQEGRARAGRDYGGEKGDKQGTYPRKPPDGWKARKFGNRSGKWPPTSPRDQGIADGLLGR